MNILLFLIVFVSIIILIIITANLYYNIQSNNRLEIKTDIRNNNSLPFIDPVDIYDEENYNNPFVYPTTRPASTAFRNVITNPNFYIPTRGIPDKPRYIANLIEENIEHHNNNHNNHNHNNHNNNNNNNKNNNNHNNNNNNNHNNNNHNNNNNTNSQLPYILQLMGQQKYYDSSKFDYYVLLPMVGSNPPIKYVVKTRNNEEVYDGDILNILNKNYRVEKNKSPLDYYY
jgi:hypothetical protein